MKSSHGKAFTYTIFGESHGDGIGVVIDGLPSGISINEVQVKRELKRRSGQASFNTPRKEEDHYEIISGYYNGYTTGTPLTVLFRNQNTQSKDYTHLKDHPRPGHADHTGDIQSKGYNDYRGGGHFSGRITTPIVFLGCICRQLLHTMYSEFQIDTHILNFQNICDTSYYEARKAYVYETIKKTPSTPYDLFSEVSKEISFAEISNVSYDALCFELQRFKTARSTVDVQFPVWNNEKKKRMEQAAYDVMKNRDTAGGTLETLVSGLPIGIGEPFFQSVESEVAHLLYSVPSVKSVSFGLGSHFSEHLGSGVKDELLHIDEHTKKITTLYNYNGGINGGITNGEDLVVQTVLKPIASLRKPQYTYSKRTKKIEILEIGGRHDSTVINRAIPVVESMICIGLYDLCMRKQNVGEYHG